jgi:hypothetical protein
MQSKTENTNFTRSLNAGHLKTKAKVALKIGIGTKIVFKLFEYKLNMSRKCKPS